MYSTASATMRYACTTIRCWLTHWLVQFSCVGHYTPYTDGADEGLAEKLVLQWYPPAST